MAHEQYPRVDCLYGWCPHRVPACDTCDEIKRIEIEKRLASAGLVAPALSNGERK